MSITTRVLRIGLLILMIPVAFFAIRSLGGMLPSDKSDPLNISRMAGTAVFYLLFLGLLVWVYRRLGGQGSQVSFSGLRAWVRSPLGTSRGVVRLARALLFFVVAATTAVVALLVVGGCVVGILIRIMNPPVEQTQVSCGSAEFVVPGRWVRQTSGGANSCMYSLGPKTVLTVTSTQIQPGQEPAALDAALRRISDISADAMKQHVARQGKQLVMQEPELAPTGEVRTLRQMGVYSDQSHRIAMYVVCGKDAITMIVVEAEGATASDFAALVDGLCEAARKAP
ncbi:MAG: hypothetical protein U0636_01000 [Phycisphaerales bacterium]